jgi:hypothetical protein
LVETPVNLRKNRSRRHGLRFRNIFAVLTQGTQAGFQLAALAVTLGISIVGGIVTGLIMKLPFIEKIKNEDDMFNDRLHWLTGSDFEKID